MSINLWALPKINPLKQLLLALHERLGPGAFALLEQRDGPRALTLCHPEQPGLQAYIHVHGQEARHFGLHLEYPPQDGLPPAVEIHEGLTRQQMLEALEIHFAPLPETAAL